MKILTAFDLMAPKEFGNFDKMVSQFVEYLGIKKPKLPTYAKELSEIPTFIGVEVEVENVKKELPLPSIWMQDSDGSLRNHGREFKSVPLRPEQVFQALSILWQVLYKASSSKPDFSWRSSIHFHIFLGFLEDEEFKKFVKLVLLFEQLFFKIAGEGREQSNFCVPLCRSSLIDNIRNVLTGKVSVKKFHSVWNNAGGEHGSGLYKYSATNFSRLSDLGTVEFRHLGGTSDLDKICLSLAVALKLYQASLLFTTTELHEVILNLNSSRKYSNFVKHVLGQEIMTSLSVESYQSLMEDTVTKVKEVSIALPFTYKKKLSKDSALIEYAELLSKKEAKKPEKK